MVVAHTRCRMAAGDEEEVHAEIEAAGGPDTRSMSFLVTDHQEEALRATCSACAPGLTSRGSRSAASSTTSTQAGSSGSAEATERLANRERAVHGVDERPARPVTVKVIELRPLLGAVIVNVVLLPVVGLDEKPEVKVPGRPEMPKETAPVKPLTRLIVTE